MGCGPQASGECKPCGSGKFKHTGTEGTSSDKCLQCPKGLFQSGTGASKCVNCLGGTYSDELGAKRCKACAAGRFGNDDAAPLDGGKPIKASSAYCHQCEFGQFQAEIGKTACVACDKGRYGNTGILQNSAKHCVACESGTFAAATGTKKCTTCHNWSPTCVYCKWTRRETGQQQCTDKPVPCEVSGWSNWGACSKSCAVGKQTRTRTVTREVLHGGKACPSLTQERQCNVHNCPVNCLVTAWQGFSRCTEVCAGGTAPAGGTKTRKRSIHRAAKFGGAKCPALTETTPCNTQTCGLCSHVKCHAVDRVRQGTHDGTGVCTKGGCKSTTKPQMHIEVLYHNQERGGDRHKCQWNKENKACECLCASSTKDPAAHHHWGAAKAEVSKFFAQIEDSKVKAAGGGGANGAGHGSYLTTNILAGQAEAFAAAQQS